MSRLYILFSTSPCDVGQFFNNARQEFSEPEKVNLYVPESLKSLFDFVDDLKCYPSPNTTWTFPEQSDKVFFLYIDPQAPLIESIDALVEGMMEADLEPDRVITLIDCESTSNSRKLADYYEACLHHSDVGLLAQRDELSKKWVTDYIKSFEKKALPTHFTFLKKGGKTDKLKYLLYPETLRVSQVFDRKEFKFEIPPSEVEASFDVYTEEEEGDEDPYRALQEGSFPEKQVPDVSSFVKGLKSS